MIFDRTAGCGFIFGCYYHFTYIFQRYNISDIAIQIFTNADEN